MNALALVLAVATTACATSSDPYSVFASAELTPMTQEITGHFDVLGTGEAQPSPYTYHRVAGYHVHLPDQQPRRVLIYTPGSCATPRASASLVWDLGRIRQVGDQAHFFIPDVEAGDRLVDLDIVTQWMFIHADPTANWYAGNLIAVVQDIVDGVHDEPGPVFDGSSVAASAGSWLACGAFRLAP